VRKGVACLVLVLTLVLSAAGCGSDGEKETTTSATTPADPGREVMGALVDAAARKDADAMWALLSKPSQRREGPTVDDFENGKARELERTLAPFAGGKLPVEVSENIGGGFGLVALSRGPNAYAVPFRKENGTWRVELPGPLRIEVLGPPPGSRGKFVNQIGVATHGPGGAGVGLLYVDGVTLDSRSYSGPKGATIFANFATKLAPGRHTAVAYASTGKNAAAKAWTFFP
jgi:hypothetical protein